MAEPEIIKTRVRIFRVGTPPEDLAVEFPDSYAGLRGVIEPLLDGQEMEHVTVLYEDQRRDMFVDGRGMLKGLARNETATAIYRANWLKHHPGNPEALEWIAGTAVLFPDLIVWT